MVNVGLNSASILGIFLAVAGASLYFLRSVRPELARDHDIFFAAVGLLCGFILIFQGWRLDPILQFGQFLLTGSTIFFAFETVRMRGIATEQAKRSTPIVDDDRPVSRVYRAELDELEPVDERPSNRRLRGTEDPRSSRTATYEGEPRTRRSSSRGSAERLGPGERPRKRRPRPAPSRPTERPVDGWEATLDDREEKPSRSSRSSNRPGNSPAESSTGRRRRRPSQEQGRQSVTEMDTEAASSEYVDYQPIDTPEDDRGGSRDFEY
jgi:hypothetical protein